MGSRDMHLHKYGYPRVKRHIRNTTKENIKTIFVNIYKAMKTTLNFENEDTKKLLVKLDFEYFLEQNIALANYSQENIDNIYHKYELTFNQLKNKQKLNKTQFGYFMEGNVRKMFTGGFLPALFQLDESRENYF